MRRMFNEYSVNTTIYIYLLPTTTCTIYHLQEEVQSSDSLVSDSQMQVSPFNLHWALHPNVYIAPYTKPIVEINGDIDKKEWNDVPWSNPFDDIRGKEDAVPDERPDHACQTRMKMMWDDEFLYIAAMIESDMEVRATYEERNSPIYHQDSDFEVFVDTNSSCHDYKELEMNAINTVWNLMLDKPYIDGGREHSGRIANPGDEDFYEVYRQKTAARLVEGSLNDQSGDQRTVWTVEIALSHRDTLNRDRVHETDTSTSMMMPKEGDLWRINFSRVEKKGTLNWTWQKQSVWDPTLRKYCGKVDMHMPDAWGYIRFGPAKSTSALIGQVPQEMIVDGNGVDIFWPLRIAGMNVYYAQRRFHDENGIYAKNVKDLIQFLDEGIMKPFMDEIILTTNSEQSSYNVFVIYEYSKGIETVLSLDNSRLMEIANRKKNTNDEVSTQKI